ncbi:MAG: PorT family protein [Prevotellaceae bacterium]|jgi:opacity protein-like surface antigen|nr:PorT family protein [Prevotellaceae bacterium]
MKKLFFAIIASVFCLTATAQDAYSSASPAERLAVGFKVAPSMAWISPNADFVSSDGSMLRFNWGFIVKYHLTENYSLISGFNVNTLGGSLKYKRDEVTLTTENKFSTFEIPFSFRLTTEPFFEKYFFFAQVGLSGSYAFNPNIKTTHYSNNLVDPAPGETLSLPDIDDSQAVNRFVFAYNLAVGAEYQATEKMAVTAQILFNNSLSSLLDSDDYRIHGSKIGGTYNFVELGVGVMFY